MGVCNGFNECTDEFTEPNGSGESESFEADAEQSRGANRVGQGGAREGYSRHGFFILSWVNFTHGLER